MDTNFSPKTIWNFDEARMRTLHWHLMLCEAALEEWNINEINKELYTLRRIISGALSEKDWGELVKDYTKLEEYKRKLDNTQTEKENYLITLKFYNKADEILLKLNRFMKKKGMFFREGEDPRFAALKR